MHIYTCIYVQVCVYIYVHIGTRSRKLIKEYRPQYFIYYLFMYVLIIFNLHLS